MLVSHITQFDAEGSCCFVHNSGYEGNREDTCKTFAPLQTDGLPQPPSTSTVRWMGLMPPSELGIYCFAKQVYWCNCTNDFKISTIAFGLIKFSICVLSLLYTVIWVLQGKKKSCSWIVGFACLLKVSLNMIIIFHCVGLGKLLHPMLERCCESWAKWGRGWWIRAWLLSNPEAGNVGFHTTAGNLYTQCFF